MNSRYDKRLEGRLNGMGLKGYFRGMKVKSQIQVK